MVSFDNGALRVRFYTALAIGPLSLFLIYWGGWPFIILLAVFFILSNQEWFKISRQLRAKTILYPLGVLYLAFCFYCFYKVGIDKSIDALVLLVLVACSDIGAYFSGKTIGGPKLAKAISPNKTWAGLFGAMLTPAIVLVLAEMMFLDVGGYISDKHGLFFIFGALIGLCGQIGDMLESYIKRQAGVKDSGTILPGHGGVLDRIDSLLLAAPAFMLLEYVLGHV